MAQLTENQQAAMRKLFTDNNLTKEDVFTSNHFVIITRAGIEKIQYNNKIDIRYEVVRSEPEFAVVKATAYTLDGKKGVETFGSASPQTVKGGNAYFMEMAEKRALSRCVLKSIRAYELNCFGVDEGVHDGLD